MLKKTDALLDLHVWNGTGNKVATESETNASVFTELGGVAVPFCDITKGTVILAHIFWEVHPQDKYTYFRSVTFVK